MHNSAISQRMTFGLAPACFLLPPKLGEKCKRSPLCQFEHFYLTLNAIGRKFHQFEVTKTDFILVVFPVRTERRDFSNHL